MMHSSPHSLILRSSRSPHDLVTALGSHKPKTDYGIESLKPSFFGRLIERLIGPRN